MSYLQSVMNNPIFTDLPESIQKEIARTLEEEMLRSRTIINELRSALSKSQSFGPAKTEEY